MDDSYIKPKELTAKMLRYTTEEFRLLYMGALVEHDQSACNALRMYDLRADDDKQPYILMREIADYYGTTVTDMKKHWPCIRGEEYYRTC